MKESIFSKVVDHQFSNLLRMSNFECIFQEFWIQIMEQILYGTYVLQDSHFWAKRQLAPSGTVLSLSFVFIWFRILHAKIKTTEFFSIGFISIGTIATVLNTFWKYWKKLTRKHLHWYGDCNYVNIPSEIGHENYVQKSYVWRPVRHMDVIYMHNSRLFSSGIKLGARIFWIPIEFNL